MTPQPTSRDRWLALGLLLVALFLVYILAVHPLWMRPLREIEARIDTLQERDLRIQQQLQQAPIVAERLRKAQQMLVNKPGFMPEASVELATSRLVQILEEAARQVSPDSRSCAISNRSPIPADTSGPFVRVAVQVRLRCGMSEWMTLLKILENGKSWLQVRRLDILTSAVVEGGGGLDVSFELSGYLRRGTAATLEMTGAQ